MTSSLQPPAPADGSRTSRGKPWLAALASVACVAPFLTKAFHIDDTLFLLVARQIQNHPTDFYGLRVNWHVTELPFIEVTRNPPLCSYYIALVAWAGGWSETVLHGAFLLPAAAAAWGSYRIAERLCARPLGAALAAILTPAFMVSASSVMCDTMLLAFWVWACVFWLDGLHRGSPGRLGVAGILVALAELTKYFGVSLIPLLFVYGVAQRRKVGAWSVALVIPVAALACYQMYTRARYGQDLLREAIAFAAGVQARSSAVMPLSVKLIVGLAFAGGCLASAPIICLAVRPRRSVLTLAALTALAAWSLYLMGSIGPLSLGGRPELILQLSLWSAAGVGIVAIAVDDLRRRRDTGALFLVLWVVGTLTFNALVNWTANARSVLPAAPAVGILLMRRLDDAWGLATTRLEPRLVGALLGAGALSLWVAGADFQLANSARDAAESLGKAGQEARWFEGHWGFHYYMIERGSRPLDVRRLNLLPGDRVICAPHNPDPVPLPVDAIEELPARVLRASSWLATMQPRMGAGFYASGIGPLPFAFGAVPPEEYRLFRVTRPICSPSQH